MFKVLAVGTVVLALGFLSSALGQSTPQAEPRSVDLSQISGRLAKDWDDQAKNPKQDERGYCVRFSLAEEKGHKSYVAVALLTGLDIRGATPYSVGFECPKGWVPLHVHTPVTCTVVEDSTTGSRNIMMDSCVLGGKDAFNSQPSENDWINAFLGWHLDKVPFNIIQWDRDKFHVYAPWDDQ